MIIQDSNDNDLNFVLQSHVEISETNNQNPTMFGDRVFKEVAKLK